MRKILIVSSLFFIAGTRLWAQQNPAVANPTLNPNPLSTVGAQFDMTCTVGNSGTVDITGIGAAERMEFTISLGKCAPSVGGSVSVLGVNALSGNALSFFDITYDVSMNMFHGVQKANVAMGTLLNGMHALAIHAQVTSASSSSTTNDIGANFNIQPNGNSAGSQAGNDDHVFIFTHTTGTPLPVALIGFEGKASGCSVSLSWNTGAEQNFDHFEIERAAGKGYRAMGTVKAKGNNSTYSFTDAQPVTGATTYRLKMVDADGTYSYSGIVAAKANCPVGNTVVSVYPNPAREAVHVSGLQEGATLRLMDITGRMLTEKTSSSTTEILDLSQLPAALYTLQVIENGAVLTSVKISKQ